MKPRKTTVALELPENEVPIKRLRRAKNMKLVIEDECGKVTIRPVQAQANVID